MGSVYLRKRNWRHHLVGAILTTIILAVGCTSVSPQKPKAKMLDNTSQKTSQAHKETPLKKKDGFSQEGYASWYGDKFHGRKTSNGETYDMNLLTAAHKTLPFDTVVSVKNIANGKSVNVRINDRGPFVQGRIIDLSFAAAKQIDMLKSGTAMVEIIALGKPTKGKDNLTQGYRKDNYFEGNFTFQLGAFSSRENAEKFKDKLSQLYNHVHVSSYENESKMLYRVRIGRCLDLNQAALFEEMLINGGHKEAFFLEEEGEYAFQLASFTDEKNAVLYKEKISQFYCNAKVVMRKINNESFFRVRVGRLTSLSQVVKFENILKKGGYSQAFIVAE